jgi:hypothetical protein
VQDPSSGHGDQICQRGLRAGIADAARSVLDLGAQPDHRGISGIHNRKSSPIKESNKGPRERADETADLIEGKKAFTILSSFTKGRSSSSAIGQSPRRTIAKLELELPTSVSEYGKNLTGADEILRSQIVD